MKFRASTVIYRAVCEGLVAGMQEARAAGDAATGEQVIKLTAEAVMQKLGEVLIFDEEVENLINLQHIAEGMVSRTEASPTPPTTQ